MASTSDAFCKTHYMVSIWDLQLTSSEECWTVWLIPAVLVRLLCFHYGTVSMSGAENASSQWCPPPFSSGMISMATKKSSSSKQPAWKCKSHNCRVVIAWLAFYTQSMVHIPEMLMFNTALTSVSRFFSAMQKHGRFLTPQQATAMQEDSFNFVAAYAACHK